MRTLGVTVISVVLLAGVGHRGRGAGRDPPDHDR